LLLPFAFGQLRGLCLDYLIQKSEDKMCPLSDFENSDSCYNRKREQIKQIGRSLFTAKSPKLFSQGENKMKRKMLLLAAVLAGAVMLAACAPQRAAAVAVKDQANLIEALRAGKATVELGETVEQAFFTVKGQIIKVNSADVQVFEYASASEMEAEAKLVAADGGSIGTNMVMWMAAPHFFKSGRMLVLYVGDDSAVLGLLKGALGQQFAGR